MCTGNDADHHHIIVEKPLNRVDPRVKMAAIFGFVAVISSLSSMPVLFAAAGLIAGLSLFSGIGALQLLRRIVLVLPFTGFVLVLLPFMIPGQAVLSIHLGLFTLTATVQGLSRAAILSLRVLSAILAVNVLTATTPIADLMRALRDFRVPDVFVQVLEFTVRYIFVLAGEVRRMKLARSARCFKNGGGLFSTNAFSTLGQLVGVLFARSWDRGERIYSAMLARGYSSGAVAAAKTSRPGWADICWGTGILAVALSLRLLQGIA